MATPRFQLFFDEPNPYVLRASVRKDGHLYGLIWHSLSKPNAMQLVDEDAQRIVDDAMAPPRPSTFVSEGPYVNSKPWLGARKRRKLRELEEQRRKNAASAAGLSAAFAELSRQRGESR